MPTAEPSPEPVVTREIWRDSDCRMPRAHEFERPSSFSDPNAHTA